MNTQPPGDDELSTHRRFMRPIPAALVTCFLIAFLTLGPWPEHMRIDPLTRNLLWTFGVVVFAVCALKELFAFLSRR